jgi:hypothetical protein
MTDEGDMMPSSKDKLSSLLHQKKILHLYQSHLRSFRSYLVTINKNGHYFRLPKTVTRNTFGFFQKCFDNPMCMINIHLFDFLQSPHFTEICHKFINT